MAFLMMHIFWREEHEQIANGLTNRTSARELMMADQPDDKSAAPMGGSPSPAAGASDTYSLTGGAVSGEIDWLAQPVPAANVSRAKNTGPVKRTSEREPPRNSRWVLIGCNAMVFLSSVCVMVLELTASRLIAKHVGSSLYTWTSVIGVVLAGITVGNFLGGWLADRAVPARLLNWLFLTASILCLSVLWLDGMMADQSRPAGWGWPAWVVFVVGVVFFLPSMSLGTISPVVASLALSHSRRFGVTVGNVYAWGALGSIVGTFLTGFVLIDTMGTRAIVALTSGTLASMGVFVALGQWAFRVAVLFGWLQLVTWIGLAAGITDVGMNQVMNRISRTITLGQNSEKRAAAIQRWENFGERFGRKLHELGLTLGLRDDAVGEYHDESNYSYINVADQTEDGQRINVLKLDKLIHSYFVPNNPTKLKYEYEKVYAAITEQAVSSWDRVTTVSLNDIRREIVQSRANAVAAKSASDSPLTGISTETPLTAASKALDEAVSAQLLSPQSFSTDDSSQEPLPALVEICEQLPAWITFDREKQELSLRGGLTSDRRDDLLRRHPYAGYWRAVERLRAMSHHADWGDFGSVPLLKLPRGVTIPETLQSTVLFDRHLQALNIYRTLDEEIAQTLLGLGDVEAVTYREGIEQLFRQSRRISTLFLGGGGFVFPRWIEALYPHDPLIHVAELDPGVKAAVQAKMGLPPDGQTRIVTTIGDARNFVDDRLRANADAVKRSEPPVLYDVVYGDAFNDFSVPWHLTTKEFSEKIARLVHPTEGIYLVNLIDIYPRSEFPVGGAKPDGTYSKIEGDIPDVLTREIIESGSWAGAPPPYEGLEIERTLDESGYRLSVRGAMSDTLRDRLQKLADGRPGFVEAVKQLRADSQRQRTGRFLGSYVNTITRVFPHVYLFSSEAGLPKDNRDTFVIVASKRKLDLTNLTQSSDHWAGTPFASLETNAAGERVGHGQINEVLANAFGVVLTDDFAPVDNLLSTVFDQR